MFVIEPLLDGVCGSAYLSTRKFHEQRFKGGADSCFEKDDKKIVQREQDAYSAEKACLEELLSDSGIGPSDDCPKNTYECLTPNSLNSTP